MTTHWYTIIFLSGRVAQSTMGGGGKFEAVLAQTDVQRGGQIVGDGLHYYVSLQRLVLSTPLPVLIGELGPEPNGVDLAYELEIAGTIGGAAVSTKAIFKLLKPVAEQVPYTTQPSDDYAFVNNLAEYIEIWNDTLGRAWAGVASVVPGDRPYVQKIEGLNRLRVVFPAYDLWVAKPDATPGTDHLDLYFNAKSLAILSGWPTKLLTKPGKALSPQGRDVQMIISPAASGRPVPPFAPPQLYPATTPADSAFVIDMLTNVSLPAQRTVKVVCSLPSQPELIPGGVANNRTEAIFTDLSLEGIELDGEALVFNAFVNSGSRPVKLTASGPITSLAVRCELVDWLGAVSRVSLLVAQKSPCQPQAMLYAGVVR